METAQFSFDLLMVHRVIGASMRNANGTSKASSTSSRIDLQKETGAVTLATTGMMQKPVPVK